MDSQLNLLTPQAIKAALEGNWEKAIETNSQILELAPSDVEAMNRLARAWRESGKVNKAKELYQRALKLDKLNVIAQRGLARLKIKAIKGKAEEKVSVSGKRFLEEAGKTKVIQLLYPAEVEILAALDSGDRVKLVVGKHRVCIHDSRGKYLGRLPDDLATRLIKLVTAGNKYEVLVKSVEGREIKVFLRELVRGEKVAQIPSFPVGEKIDYVAFTPPELVHKEKPDVSTLEEEEEFRSLREDTEDDRFEEEEI